jgi:hypothetical protein
MASKKKAPPAGLRALRIGSRVCRTDTGAEGRIAWANGVSVKVAWDGGEQVTWRRDSLADRPITILTGEEGQPTARPVPAAVEPTESQAVETPPVAPETAQEPPAADAPAPGPAPAEAAPVAAEAALAAGPPSPAPGATEAATTAPAEARQTVAGPKEKRLGALDAAARVLGEAGRAMSCQELIGVMAARGYWTSPGGKTPAATLYSAITREIQAKGAESRFAKAARGQFARRGA